MGCNNTAKPLRGSMKTCFLLCVLCLLPLCLFNGWLRRFQSPKPSTYYNLNRSRNVTVLLWYWPFGKSFSLRSDVCWDIYHIPHCRLVDQKSWFSAADVVVFHHRELVQGRKLPLDLPRPTGQRWVWMSLEAPVYNGMLRKYANVFNLTMTYRRDADITIPYGEIQPNTADGGLVHDIPQNKSSLVCWVVTNYKHTQKRSQVYNELKTIVPVTVYGRWTKTRLPSSALLPTISRCYFYLAFENSVAKDYITEKLWRNSYQAGTVPVVLGPPVQDYNAVAPPNSFIHVDEFASMKDLGEHLQQLAADKKRYSEYFKWREEWKVKLYRDWRERLCKICSQYNQLPQYKVYSDLDAWVYSGDKHNNVTLKA